MKTALVVTSISAPNAVLEALAEGCRVQAWDFLVAGDTKSPADFRLNGCRFLSIEAQQSGPHSLGRLCPTRSYTRKNIAYLEAIAAGARVIVETDDDNFPRPAFWAPRRRHVRCHPVESEAWVNVYSYFTQQFIYPRGLPLDHARDRPPTLAAAIDIDCPLQQGLADANPDVDAVYRMLFPLPFDFDSRVEPVALLNAAWCPFNSQNTTFFEEVFPLLYLPAHCSFRMTDIWRSFVAQRILHHIGYPVLFHGATVWQERNDHSLHRDFCDEIPGYQHNDAMRDALMTLDFGGSTDIPRLMERCYETLMSRGWVGAQEEVLLRAWFADLAALQVGKSR